MRNLAMRNLAFAAATTFGLICLGTTAHAKTVELKVGQTKHITAYRGFKCGSRAPTFGDLMKRIPKSKLVTYSDGGPSSRVSDQCKRRVPTRAINGTAVKAGKETKRYQSGTVTIVVK
jgi:hypothetical protein